MGQNKIGDPLPIDNHAEALAQIEDLRKQIHMVKNSLSWRITAPLRLMVSIFILTFKILLYVPLKIIGPHLDRHPDFTYQVIEKLRKFPRLHGVLSRSLAQTRGLRHSTKQNPFILKNPASTRLDYGFVWESDLTGENASIQNRTILFYIGHTLFSSRNSGTQRLVRRFSAELLKHGYKVFFVKWNRDTSELSEISLLEFEHLSKWNGPQFFDQRTLSSIDIKNSQLIVPESACFTEENQPSILALSRWARKHAISISAFLHDHSHLCIDCDETSSEHHRRHMLELLEVDLVISNSKHSQKKLLDFWATEKLPEGIIKPNVISLPLAIDSFTENEFSRYNAQSRIILCVGAIKLHNGQLLLASAFNKYVKENPGSDWELHLVGKVHPDEKFEFELLIRNSHRIVYHGLTTEDRLNDLYNLCSFTICTSIEDGGDHVITESLSHGRPSICANFGAMAEAASDGGCLTIDVQSVNQLSNAIHLMTTQIGHRTLLKSQIPTASDLRSWKNYVETFVSISSEKPDQRNEMGIIYFFFDSTLRFKHNTGIQRVVRQTASALLKSGFQLIPITWDPDQRLFTTVPAVNLEFMAQWNGPAVELWSPWFDPAEAPSNSWFLQPELPTEHLPDFHTDVIHSAKSIGLKSIHLFYDAIPVTLSYLYPRETSLRHGIYMEQLVHYDLVVPISKHSANDLGGYLLKKGFTYRTIEQKIKPAELPGEFTDTPRITSVKTTLNQKPKILMVSTLEPRKNHQTLLKAFEIAHAKLNGQLELVLAGYNAYPDVVQLVESFAFKYPEVRWERSADDAMLRALYSSCDFTVYPSIEEGFGLPILESQWNGRPCICADTGSMKEIAVGGGALTVPITNAEALAHEIVNLISDKALYNKLSNECVSRQFKTWTDYGSELISLMCHF